jgi:hypothetical protein
VGVAFSVIAVHTAVAAQAGNWAAMLQGTLAQPASTSVLMAATACRTDELLNSSKLGQRPPASEGRSCPQRFTFFKSGKKERVAALTSISYIAVSVGLPLHNETPLALDRALGFDVRSYPRFIYNRPRLLSLLASGYGAIQWQILLVIVGLPLAGYRCRAGQFICGFTLA